MSSKKKYLEKLEKLERSRHARNARTAKKGDKVRELSASYKGRPLNKKLTQKEMDQWATNATGIKTDQGKNKDKAAGRTLGRFIKGKL